MSRQSPYLRFLTIGMAVALLSACGGKEGEGEQTVALRDMEVVDGTATDAMTDLDGIQTEGIALPPAVTATRPASPAAEASNSTAATDTEEGTEAKQE